MSEKKSGLPIFLIASLCVNAALIGAVAAGFHNLKSGHQSHGKHEKHDGDRGGPPGGGPFEDRLARSAFDTLSPEKRKEFRQTLAEEWNATRGTRDEMASRTKALAAVIAAENFDRAQAAALLAENREAEDQFRARRHERLLDLLESLTPEQRKTLIDQSLERLQKFEEKMQKFRDKRGDGPPHMGPDGPPPHGPPPEGLPPGDE